jgi:hypothetical protein
MENMSNISHKKDKNIIENIYAKIDKASHKTLKWKTFERLSMHVLPEIKGTFCKPFREINIDICVAIFVYLR